MPLFDRDVSLEITLFDRIFSPSSSVQSLLTIVKNGQRLRRVTMSLIMMIELKRENDGDDDQQQEYEILERYTQQERLYEVLHDFS